MAESFEKVAGQLALDAYGRGWAGCLKQLREAHTLYPRVSIEQLFEIAAEAFAEREQHYASQRTRQEPAE